MKSITDKMMYAGGRMGMPCLGFGVFQVPDGEATLKAVRTALEVGYRHIDTAAGYGNEASVGQAMRQSGIAREDIFLTTKHWISERGYDRTIRAVEASLSRLGTDYLDLYLIHWPMTEITSPDWREVNASTWKGFERMMKDGKIRSIGVSNFLPQHMEPLMERCEIMPQVNQLEFHPGYAQLDAVRWCQERGILVQAWSALGSGRLLGHPLLNEIAAKYGKSSAQLCLRYALQHDVVPLVKSVHEDRIRSNTELFDFEISAEDMQTLDRMERAGYSGWHPDEGPAEHYLD